MSNRTRGDYFERTTKHALEREDWFVIRAAGSHGIADLVALRADDEGRCVALLISCKISGRIGRAERAHLLRTAGQTGSIALVAMRKRRGWITLARQDDTGALRIWEDVRAHET